MPKATDREYQKTDDVNLSAGKRWRRRSAGAYGRPRLTLLGLAQAVRGVARYAGTKARAWSDTDTATMAEAEASCWGYGEVQAGIAVGLPTWLTTDREVTRLDGSTGPLIPRRRGAGYVAFIAWVAKAERAGALGLQLSYEEIASIVGAARRTVARWVKEWERLGLLEILRTFERHDGGEDEHTRDRRRSIYRLGALVRSLVGVGIYEGAKVPHDRKAARKAAMAARDAARARRKAKKAEQWQSNNPRLAKTSADHPAESPAQASGSAEGRSRPASDSAESGRSSARRPAPGSGARAERGASPLILKVPQRHYTPPTPSGEVEHAPRSAGDGGGKAGPAAHESFPSPARADATASPPPTERSGAGDSIEGEQVPRQRTEPGAGRRALERPDSAESDAGRERPSAEPDAEQGGIGLIRRFLRRHGSDPDASPAKARGVFAWSDERSFFSPKNK